MLSLASLPQYSSGPGLGSAPPAYGVGGSLGSLLASDVLLQALAGVGTDEEDYEEEEEEEAEGYFEDYEEEEEEGEGGGAVEEEEEAEAGEGGEDGEDVNVQGLF